MQPIPRLTALIGVVCVMWALHLNTSGHSTLWTYVFGGIGLLGIVWSIVDAIEAARRGAMTYPVRRLLISIVGAAAVLACHRRPSDQ